MKITGEVTINVGEEITLKLRENALNKMAEAEKTALGL